MKDLEGLQGAVPAELAAGEEGRQAGRGGLPRRRPLRRADPPRSSSTSRPRFHSRTPPMAKALRALVKWYQTGEERRPGRVRHRLGAGQELAGGHDQRVHRGLHGPARPQGLVGSARVLRQPREDRGHPQARGRRAVVRGPDALGGAVPEAGCPGHHRQRHRRRRRNRRFRADHAGRHQPAERSEHPREVRQQVGVAVERQRGLRPVDVRGVPPRVRVDAGRGGSARRSGAASPAS